VSSLGNLTVRDTHVILNVCRFVLIPTVALRQVNLHEFTVCCLNKFTVMLKPRIHDLKRANNSLFDISL